MLDYNVIFAMLIGAIIVMLMVYVLPALSGERDIFKDIKTGLLLFGYAFRDEKIKAITNTVFQIVSTIEKLNKSSVEKQNEAIDRAMVQILDEFDIQLDREVVALIVDIAVSKLPKTHK